MAHELQTRYSNLVDEKLRSTLVTKDNLIFNTRYEGDPKAGMVKVPVRDTEVEVKKYNKAKGVDITESATSYFDLAIDNDEAVNELVDGYDARQGILSITKMAKQCIQLNLAHLRVNTWCV